MRQKTLLLLLAPRQGQENDGNKENVMWKRSMKRNNVFGYVGGFVRWPLAIYNVSQESPALTAYLNEPQQKKKKNKKNERDRGHRQPTHNNKKKVGLYFGHTNHTRPATC